MKMSIEDISGQIACTHTNGYRDLGLVNELIVHHSATGYEGESLALAQSIASSQMNGERYALISGDAKVHPDGIQYHFMIHNGKIYRVRNDNAFLWHAGNYEVNRTSLALCIIGNYDIQNISDEDRLALSSLVWMLSFNDFDDFKDLANINTASGVLDRSVRCHGEVVADDCPGLNLKPIIIEMRNSKLQSAIDFMNLHIAKTTAPAVVNMTPDLSGQVALLTNQLNTFQAENINLTNQIQTLQTSIVNFQRQNETLQSTNNALASQIVEQKAQIDTLNNTNALEGQNLVNEESKDKGLTEKISSLEEKINSLQSSQQSSQNGVENVLSRLNQYLSRYGL